MFCFNVSSVLVIFMVSGICQGEAPVPSALGTPQTQVGFKPSLPSLSQTECKGASYALRGGKGAKGR